MFHDSSAALPQNSVVKSAARVLRILELFATLKRPMKSGEVAGAMDMPSSSTSVLLHSLVSLGYLVYNDRTRTFVTTYRVAFLGLGYFDGEASQGLLEKMRELAGLSRESVLLAMENGYFVQRLGFVRGSLPLRDYGTQGTRRVLPLASCGIALLARRPDVEIGKIVRSVRAREQLDKSAIEVGSVMRRVERYRERGYEYLPHSNVPNVGVVACRLPSEPSMTIGIIGASERIRKNEERLGDMLVSSLGRA